MEKKLSKHASNLKNYGSLKKFTHKCVYKNHTCGDKIKIYLKINKSIIKKISYETESCLICSASSSIFSNCVKNKDINKVLIFSKKFIKLIFSKNFNLNGKWKEFNFLLKKSYFNRKNCILVPFNALIKIK
jgi:nitrogen fixation NifU-like protein